ncbi:MAG: hypothetical protein JXB14_07445 [Candidatus Altiarchaeota archaeon]|nr:hypothetical protein [Candidatus Altiarchaeota archaeon]
MEPKQVQKLREAVIQGLRDGRRMETLKSALRDSGYSESDVDGVISTIDEAKIRRRPQKKDFKSGYIASAIIVVVVVFLGYYVLFGQPSENPTGGITPPGNGNNSGDPPTNETQIKICYASNESIKQVMIEAGAKCDRWYIIKPSP